jgi:hypothetical protein
MRADLERGIERWIALLNRLLVVLAVLVSATLASRTANAAAGAPGTGSVGVGLHRHGRLDDLVCAGARRHEPLLRRDGQLLGYGERIQALLRHGQRLGLDGGLQFQLRLADVHGLLERR